MQFRLDPATEPESPLAAIAEWASGRRWFRLVGIPDLAVRGIRRVGPTHPESGVEVHEVLLADATTGTLYYVPIALDALDPQRLGVPADAVVCQSEGVHLVDAATHPHGVLVLLAEALRDRSVMDRRIDIQPLRGEQSNTSVIVDRRWMLKVLRTLIPGHNPDVEVLHALGTIGTDGVPVLVGSKSTMWEYPDTGRAVVGTCIAVTEFLPDCTDGWELILDQFRALDADAVGRCRELGTATAQLHADLRIALASNTSEIGPEAVAARLRRVYAAVAETSSDYREIRPIAAKLNAVLDRVIDELAGPADAGDPELPADPERPRSLRDPRPGLIQRIHGDFHLGQTLWHPHRGWTILDFEGQPLDSWEERHRPDFPARDVAGMTRSIDYAAEMAASTPPDDAPDFHADAVADLATACRRAFLAAYGATAGPLTPSPALLAAMEVEKALYEYRYEVLHRPSWSRVPLAALTRLARSRD